jgi:flagellar hook-associated protein 3 FlgL
MTRVASFSQSQIMLAATQKRQADVFDAQTQVSTGKKSTRYAGYAPQVSALTSARAAMATAEAHVRVNKQLATRLDITDQQLTRVLESAQSVRATVLSALSSNQAAGFAGALEADLKTAVSSLNTEFDGQYLFAGARGGQPPVRVQKLSDLLPLASGQAAFRNDALKSSLQVADGVDLPYGQLADEIAAPLMDSLRRLAQLDNVSPLQGPLTASQQTALQSELASLNTAISRIQDQQSVLGITSNQLDRFTISAQTRAEDLDVFVGDIENVDLAEALTRLNNDRTALEASYKVTGALSKLSLLNYI